MNLLKQQLKLADCVHTQVAKIANLERQVDPHSVLLFDEAQTDKPSTHTFLTVTSSVSLVRQTKIQTKRSTNKQRSLFLAAKGWIKSTCTSKHIKKYIQTCQTLQMLLIIG